MLIVHGDLINIQIFITRTLQCLQFINQFELNFKVI